jgi:hypothetical protein
VADADESCSEELNYTPLFFETKVVVGGRPGSTKFTALAVTGSVTTYKFSGQQLICWPQKQKLEKHPGPQAVLPTTIRSNCLVHRVLIFKTISYTKINW